MAENLIPLRIAGVGYSIPETVVTNDDLTKLYDTSDEWIYTRTGIKERRVCSGNEDAIELGLKAAQNALEKSGIKPEELDLIIAASSAPPQLYPAIACHIQARLGIETDIPAFDITAACSRLIYGLQVAKGFINSGIYKNILRVDKKLEQIDDLAITELKYNNGKFEIINKQGIVFGETI